MAKELIISANVHEKKVTIMEDGVVTEFYVERRDENQGVVGNLYKGRVMKVLPGMQSAFVDIGLERDAFLYVSDFTEFMEEEDEIDFREAGEERAAAVPQRAEERPRPDDRQRRGDRYRQEGARVAPEAPREEHVGDHPVAFEDVVEQLAEIADESVIPPPTSDEELEEGIKAAGEQSAFGEEQQVEEARVDRVEDWIGERVTDEPGRSEVQEPAEAEAGAATELEQAASAGAQTEAAEPEEKPKRGRGRKRAAEPEAKKSTRVTKKKAEKPEPKKAAESRARKPAAKTSKRTSRKGKEEQDKEENSDSSQTAQQFHRVTDEDLIADAGDLLKDAIVQEKIIEQVHSAEYTTAAQRPAPEPEPEWRVGSFRSGDAAQSGFQRVVDEHAEQVSAEAASQTGPGETAAFDQFDESITPFRHINDFVPDDLLDRAQSAKAGEIGEVTGFVSTGEEGDETGEQMRLSASDEAEGEQEASVGEERAASVRERGSRAEFAVRRGGRGRRRRGGPPDGKDAPPSQADEEKSAPVPVTDVEEVAAVEPQKVEPQKEESHPRQQNPRGRGGRFDRRPGDRRPDDRRPDDRRPDGQRRPEASSTRRSEIPSTRRAERGASPTISDLLHEGQEILVQIAKEPIAKKGARITSHMALPGRYLVYMPTVNHVGVSRKIPNEIERIRLKRLVATLREREGATGGFIARTACAGHSEQELHDDMRYLLRTWADIRKKADRVKAPSLIHRDLDLVQRILRDQLSEEYTAIRVDNEVEYARIVEFVNRVQPKLVNRVKLYTGNQPILEKYGIQPEIDKAVRPRVWLRSGGYIVINQTEALVAIDVNTGKFVGKSDKLEDTITKTNMEAAKEIVRQIRLRDLGGIIVIDFIDMEERKNRQRVLIALQQELQSDRAPSKILSINDFGLMAITRKRVKQSLERTLCTPCPYCQGAGMVKSAQTMCFEILEQAKAMSKQMNGSEDVMLRVSPDVAEAFHTTEREVLEEIEAYFGTPVTIEADPHLHQEQYDFAIV
ncbi:MAG TPA: Rne/Rng family ribonuclease [Blastocatellia bacterium]|nr:Rne/Rng family ribonuclease [Blastocatellia bacterium]